MKDNTLYFLSTSTEISKASLVPILPSLIPLGLNKGAVGSKTDLIFFTEKYPLKKI